MGNFICPESEMACTRPGCTRDKCLERDISDIQQREAATRKEDAAKVERESDKFLRKEPPTLVKGFTELRKKKKESQ